MGPLEGVRVVEFAGLGPAPFAGMMLADLGADVIRIDRDRDAGNRADITSRGRRSVFADLKSADGVAFALDIAARSDILLEGFRPGTMERLGLGPDDCLARNPSLVYGRMTGWGQEGPLARTAGHDITYIALSGALSAIGRAGEAPVPPVNLVGDYGGGAMVLLVGVLAALQHVARGGPGQVVDAAMVDGSALLLAPFYGLHATGGWGPRGTNLLDGGSPFYDVYEAADGAYLAVGPLEPKFFAEFLDRVGLSDIDVAAQYDQSRWPQLRARIAHAFAQRPGADWEAAFDGSDACVTRVLDLDDAPAHPHNRARGTFIEVDGIVQPAPAPRFSATPGAVRWSAPNHGADTDQVAAELDKP